MKMGSKQANEPTKFKYGYFAYPTGQVNWGIQLAGGVEVSKDTVVTVRDLPTGERYAKAKELAAKD